MSVPEATSDVRPRLEVRGETRAERSQRLAANEISLAVLMLAAVAVSQAFPFKPVKYAVMGVLGAAFLAQVARHPPVALAMLAFITPALEVIPIRTGIPLVNAETLLVVLAVVIWARDVQLRGRDQFGPPLGRVLLAYALLVVLSAVNAFFIWHTPLSVVLAAAKNHLVFMAFLPVAFHVARERREQIVIVAAISLSLMLNALQAINHSWIAFFAGSLERHRAMAILALQPNTFGAALAMYLPVFVLFALNKVANRALQLWSIAVAGALSFALLLTLSRGSWLGAVAGLAAIAVLGDRRLIVVLAIAAASYTFWVPQAAIERVEVTTRIDEQDGTGEEIAEGSTQMRIEQYNSLGRMMAPRPVFGWGYESYPRVFERLGTLQRAKGAHSSYVQLATEGGVIGLASLVAVVLATMWAGWRGFRVCRDPFHRWLAMGVLGGMLSMAVSMASGARFEPQKIFVFFWIFAGIVQRETIVALRARGGR